MNIILVQGLGTGKGIASGRLDKIGEKEGEDVFRGSFEVETGLMGTKLHRHVKNTDFKIDTVEKYQKKLNQERQTVITFSTFQLSLLKIQFMKQLNPENSPKKE